jgi:SAM-dependent MidA family methyltransferase
MADALRVAKRVPEFAAVLDLHLVECSPRLIEQQRAILTAHHPAWVGDVADVPRGPAIVIANEFLDALPVRQLSAHGGAERVVTIDDTGRLQFAWRAAPGSAQRRPDQAIHQLHDLSAIAPLLHRQDPIAVLVIDYGGTRAHPNGDTLQAVRAHHFEHPLTSPGEADLSVQIDFGQVAAAGRAAGLAVDGPMTQADFLGRLGITERATHLIATNPAQANTIETAIARLLAPTGMGTHFQVLALRTPELPPPPAF